MAAINYHHLRYFWAVAHEGNLTRAAKKLRVSQSAVSAQIRSLEEDLGHELFIRSGRTLRLTEAGRIALVHADVIFSAGDELVGTLNEAGADRNRVIRVGALSTLSRNFQFGFLEPMLRRGDVEVSIRSGPLTDLITLLDELRVDVVLANVIPRRRDPPTWDAHMIADQPVSLVGRPNRARLRRTLVELLSTEPLVVPSSESSIRVGFDALVARLGVRPRITAQVDDMAMLRLLAREHTGLSVVPPVVVKDELESGELAEVARLEDLHETFYAIAPIRRFPNPLVGVLIQTAAAQVG